MKIAIVGYGNVGKGVLNAIKQNDDMELFGVFTRRDPKSIIIDEGKVNVYHVDDIDKYKDEIDVVILCSGSANDLPVQGPSFASRFNVIDSFDTHARIPEYFEKMDMASKKGNTVSIISVGWDPGLFSLNRLYGSSILPKSEYCTFWGKGVSQGHSDAIRRVDGVKKAIQYTVPVDEAVEKARMGSMSTLTTRDKHTRVCYVVPHENADKAYIEKTIKEMPNYFSDYDTTVNFISEEEFDRDHKKMPHGGFVIVSGETGNGNKEVIEYSLKLDSNPEFTASVLVAYARAAYRLSKNGDVGAKTVFDIAPGLLSPKTPEELRKEML